jgi:hypothetical protein
MPKRKQTGRNQGEGDKASARKYNANVRDFVASKKVDGAAKSAKDFLEANPAEAAHDEAVAKAGPHPVTKRIGELIDEGKAMVARAADRVRARLGRKTARKPARKTAP